MAIFNLALKNGDKEILEFLKNQGANMFAVNKYGRNALHLACFHNNLKAFFLCASTNGNKKILEFKMAATNPRWMNKQLIANWI